MRARETRKHDNAVDNEVYGTSRVEKLAAVVAALEAEDGQLEAAARRLGIYPTMIRLHLREAGLRGLNARIRERVLAEFHVPPLAESTTWRVPCAPFDEARHRLEEMAVSDMGMLVRNDPAKALEELLERFRRVGGLWSLVARELKVTPRCMKYWVADLRARVPSAEDAIARATLDTEESRAIIRQAQGATPPKKGSKRRGRPKKRKARKP